MLITKDEQDKDNTSEKDLTSQTFVSFSTYPLLPEKNIISNTLLFNLNNDKTSITFMSTLPGLKNGYQRSQEIHRFVKHIEEEREFIL
jgi:hypothetical protein